MTDAPAARAEAILTNADIEAACEASRAAGSPATDPDVQEALSKRYAPDVVRILRLRSGRFAVYNHAGELCGIIGAPFADSSKETMADGVTKNLMVTFCPWPPAPWHPFQPTQPKPIDLEELGLL